MCNQRQHRSSSLLESRPQQSDKMRNCHYTIQRSSRRAGRRRAAPRRAPSPPSPQAAVAYDASNYDCYASSYDDLDGGRPPRPSVAAARRRLAEKYKPLRLEGRRGDGAAGVLLRRHEDIKEVTFVDACRRHARRPAPAYRRTPAKPFKTEVAEVDAAALGRRAPAFYCVVDTSPPLRLRRARRGVHEFGRVVKARRAAFRHWRTRRSARSSAPDKSTRTPAPWRSMVSGHARRRAHSPRRGRGRSPAHEQAVHADAVGADRHRPPIVHVLPLPVGP